MAIVAEEQQESLERREELIRELEFAEQMTRRDMEEREEAKIHRKAELEGQVRTAVMYIYITATV